MCPSDKLIDHQLRCRKDRENTKRSKSKDVSSEAICFFAVLETASNSQFSNGGKDDPFTFANFTMEGAPYDLLTCLSIYKYIFFFLSVFFKGVSQYVSRKL